MRSARETDDRASCVCLPVWSAKSSERRNEVDAVGGLERTRQLFGLTGGFDDAKSIAQPLNGGAGDEDRRFERVRGRAARVACDGRQQTIPCGGTRRAG